jgi:hypothetical protein
MRKVKIVPRPSRSHPHAAVDLETGSVLLKHQDDYALIALCRRLGWTIAHEQRTSEFSRRTKGFLVHN